MLVAHDARELSALIERRVEERRDAPRLQVVAQLAGPRVIEGVEGGHGAQLGEGREVRGGSRGQNFLASRVLVCPALVRLDTAHPRPLAIEHPDVHPPHLEGGSGGLCDGAKHAGEIAVLHDGAAREPSEDASEIYRSRTHASGLPPVLLRARVHASEVSLHDALALGFA